jgi:protocadherin alpha
VTDTSDEELQGLVQVIPGRVKVEVRPGSPQTFEVQVKPANNFPIDLYLLMDLSLSMSDDLSNLKRLGTQLADRITEISNNFTLGFGSFVDKKRGSFVNLDPRRLLDPCLGGCDPTYSFRHIVPLTKDAQTFSDRVNEQQISGNQDFPEGGFDGFLQAIVCTDVIGWRAVSRKILLYISDAGFHFAGDGLLGGVIKPNDGECHMQGGEAIENPDGTLDYNLWDRLDYPSIGQVAEKLDEFDIIPIFAVVRSFQDLYGRLQRELGNRAYLGELAADSRNVVTLVEQLYREISTSIVFSSVNVPGVSVSTIITDCPQERGGVCSNVMSGQTVRFNVSVDVTECTPELQAGPREVELRIVGFGSVVVELSAICDCNCDAMREQNSPVCNSQGTLVCGICECNTGYFGDRCQCDSSGTTNDGLIECPTGLDNRMCSGRGTCTCGICECRRDINGEERFYGPQCECDNTVCERGTGNEICSGPSQGECTCEGCLCLPEPVTGMSYMLSDCSCTPNRETCFDPMNTTDVQDVCNGRGTCECGECVCEEGPYFGDYCQLCSGDPVCQQRTCMEDGNNALCTSCVLDLLDTLNDRDIDSEQLFSDEGLAVATGVFPEDSVLTAVTYGDEDELTAKAIFLPRNFSQSCSESVGVSTCPQFVIVNETLELEYEIEGVLATRCPLGRQCVYTYYVSIDEREELLPIHIGYPPTCASPRTGASLAIPPWAIALIIIGILSLLGLLILALLKFLLVLLDYSELKKFEKELEQIKYNKNENPLYHSATTEHKNPIYGQ